MSTRIHIVVPDELLERIDAERGLIQRSRWIVALIENAMVAAPLIHPEAEQAQRTTPEPARPKVPPVSQTWRR